MQYHYNTLHAWSKRFAALWPLSMQPNGQMSRLPRLTLAHHTLPRFVRSCATTTDTINLFRLLDWERLTFPDSRQWFGRTPIPLSAYICAFLLKIEHGLRSMGHLRRFLVRHPALIWACGFPLYGRGTTLSPGFDPEACLPSARHLSRVLREMDNLHLQSLLDGQVAQLYRWFPGTFGQTISVDTKHIIGWCAENNPKAYIKEGRFDNTRQVAGDPDCKLGCKRRRNQYVTPTKEGMPGTHPIAVKKEWYWGYASGVVATKVAGRGEFILAELTQTFEKGDVRYFFPLMQMVENRLGFRPRYAALDAAFDAFYVYEYFHNPAHDGFAAVPLNQPNGHIRQFDAHGLPLCEAGLAMPVRKTYTDRTKAIIHHRRAFHACPLLFPQPSAQSCPVSNPKWRKGGCSVQIPVSIGARLRHRLDRDGSRYKAVYAHRTAVERIFSRAVYYGIERPKLRSQPAITNYNTLIYLLINLHSMQHVLPLVTS